MKKPESMRNINPFGLRLQPDVKQRLEEAAERNKRSLNAEISARLEHTLAEDDFHDQQAEHEAWLKENASAIDEDGMAIALMRTRQAIDEAQSNLKRIERLHDERTGEHTLIMNKDGNLIKSYEE